MQLTSRLTRQKSQVALLAYMEVTEDYIDSVRLNFDAHDLSAIF